jgi:uncharacterized phage protein gp47/JayE
MATVFKNPSDIAQQYLLYVKSLKPEVDISKTDSDWYIRGQVVGGVVSGIYADQQLISNDAFPQSARHDALANHLFVYFNRGFNPATQAIGNILVTGATGSSVVAGQQFSYDPNGNIYTATTTVTFAPAATAADVPVKSVATGQNQNLLSGAVLTLVSPPGGINPKAVADGNISDGTDIESDPEAAAKILRQIQLPIAGGKTSDYIQFAEAASPSVTSASILRFPFGLGTVGVVITSGTTDVDTALNNGIPVITTPSDALVDQVQAYVDTVNPITDCATVLAPATVGVAVTVRVRFASGDINTKLVDPVNTVTPGVTLTQGQFVTREIQRALYKTPVGGRRLGASGYVVLSEIEDLIDENIGAGAYSTGAIVQIVLDREVDDLAATGPNLLLLGNQQALPGVITVVEVT